MKSANELVSFAESKLGTNYVYGMKGAVLTQAKYDLLKKTYGTDMVWDSDVSKVGTVCVDCSGLISWFTGKVRNSTSFKNTATKVLSISKISEAVPGCLVWRSGHIGVYAGNGYIIEARGSAYGVVKTRVSERDFTHVLWCADIDYSNTGNGVSDDNVSSSSEATPQPSTNVPAFPWVGTIANCTTVNVRTAPGTWNSILKGWPKLAAGNLVEVLAKENDRDGDMWYKVNIQGNIGYVYHKYVNR